MKLKNINITPLLYAAILFLLIRLTNDVTIGADYLSHSWRYIAVELAGVIAGSYLSFYLAVCWIGFCARRHVNAVVEYTAVVLVPSLMALAVMSLSHVEPVYSDISEATIPVVVTALMSVWLYLTFKYRYLDRLYAESRLREQQAITARTEADLQLLRSQYHPHFLFNMLNTIYFSIDESNVMARGAVEHLSNLLRAQIYDGRSAVTVSRELSVLDSYLELCRMRFGEAVEIDVSFDRRFGSDAIHPHLLLPLVENAFKHSGGSPRRVKVELRRDYGLLDFRVVNTVGSVARHKAKESGLGLVNLRKRLNLLYPGRHEFTIENKDSLFSAWMRLKL